MSRFVLSSALLFAVTVDAEACRCRQPPEPKKALEQSDAVFLGKVTSIETKGTRNVVTFELQTSWKGARTKSITVSTNTSSAACGVSFGKGKVYLVYAKGKGGLQTNLCTRTCGRAAAKQDIEALGEGQGPE